MSPKKQPDRQTNYFYSEMIFGHSSDTLSTRAYAAVMTRRYEINHNSSKRRSDNPEMSPNKRLPWESRAPYDPGQSPQRVARGRTFLSDVSSSESRPVCFPGGGSWGPRIPKGAFYWGHFWISRGPETNYNCSEIGKVGARSLEKIPSFICTSQKIVGGLHKQLRSEIIAGRNRPKSALRASRMRRLGGDRQEGSLVSNSSTKDDP